MREIKTDLNNILSLITTADDYGWNKTILMEAFAEMLGTLSDNEITGYAKSLCSQDGYTVEDYISVSKKLIKFREIYIK